MKKQTNPLGGEHTLPENPKENIISDAADSTTVKRSPTNAHPVFSIVGIGASAGGLEALELFLRNVLPGSGLAYVIVQHLDPTHKGIMVELLQRTTHMPVTQVKDRMPVEPDNVYVIPPNKDMSILHGVLHLFAPAEPRGLRLPIDFFLRSLADDQQERSVGVILSGMGSDGTLGLRAIKEKGGAIFVQSPDSAKFDGMPRSAIDAGLADVVSPVEELPGKITAFLAHVPFLTRPDLVLEVKNQSGLEKVLILLRAQTGHDFSLYKKSTIYRRIERRMGLQQIDRIANYVRFLQENPQETNLLFKELLIGVTSFFRDPAAWEYLKKKAIPQLLERYPNGGVLRAWTVGCSTGEEAYSLAIIFKEALEQAHTKASFSLQIFATDLDHDAIDKARQGFFPANIAADITPERLRRFFNKEESGYRVAKEIREMVVFAPQNLVMDAPFTKLDILVCRNLLIYFESELQHKILPLFHYSLNPGGILFLGNSETIGSFTKLFPALENNLRLYRRSDVAQQFMQADLPTPYFPAISARLPATKATDNSPKSITSLTARIDQLILKRFAPAAVLTNDKGDILYISGRTGKYLEPAAGKANLNIFAMAREGLHYDLNRAFQKAIREKTVVTVNRLTVGTNGGTQTLDLTIQPLTDVDGLQGMLLVVFTDVAQPPLTNPPGKTQKISGEDAQKKALEMELQRIYEELQTTREEMQTSQEELKSANEELQSTNEELQSTNEELTTSKEEMQSLNEELQTVNHELQARLDDLSRTNNDMKNLLDSTNIATLFLDDSLRVRRFTHQATKLINLIPGDIGRPVTDIASDLLYPELTADVEDVLRTLVYKEKAVSTRRGKWFSIRIMPYRTLENRIDGVVITLMDISVAKRLEAELRQSEKDALALVKYLPNAFGLLESIFDEAGSFQTVQFVYINEAFEHLLGDHNASVQGKTIRQVLPASDVDCVKIFEDVLTSGTPAKFEVNQAPGGKHMACHVYRPGESRLRTCLILEEIGQSGDLPQSDERGGGTM